MRFVIYEDVGGGYRWRLKTRNGRKMADSAEAYTRRRDCRIAVLKIKLGVATAKVSDG